MVNDVEFKFEVPGCGHEFRVESFQVTEELSKPFHISLSLLSLDPDISFDTLIRKAGSLTLYGQGVGAARVFNGVVNEVRYLGSGRRFSRYQLVLVPQAWFLSQRQDCRIFQQKSASDIIAEVLDDGSVTDYRLELSGIYPAKEYVLQYRESDLHFVQRIMAEHGMWYYFEHTDTNHTMVIVDSNDAIAPLLSTPLNSSYLGPVVYHADGGGVADREHITDLELVNRVRTGQVTYTDYNYEHPKIPQEMTNAGDLDQDLKQFDYPGRYFDPAMGQVRTTEWMSEHIVDNQQVEASSDVMRLASGYSFNIGEHPRSEINRDYIMLSVVHTGQDPQVHEDETSGMPTTYYNHFACIPRDVVFKAPKLSRLEHFNSSL